MHSAYIGICCVGKKYFHLWFYLVKFCVQGYLQIAGSLEHRIWTQSLIAYSGVVDCSEIEEAIEILWLVVDIWTPVGELIMTLNNKAWHTYTRYWTHASFHSLPLKVADYTNCKQNPCNIMTVFAITTRQLTMYFFQQVLIISDCTHPQAQYEGGNKWGWVELSSA